MYKVTTHMKGKSEIIGNIINLDTGEIYEPKFQNYTCPEDYKKDGIEGLEPMTAKEYLNPNMLTEMLDSEDYIAEEKLDGTRQLLYLLSVNRLFSRNIVKKTGWYAENSDKLPHLRDFDTPKELYGTILDGELRIDGQGFKEVSSTMNCVWDEAILRQTRLGFVTLHAFDIIYYKGVYVAKLPLRRRKELLKKVVDALGCEYVKCEPYAFKTIYKYIDQPLIDAFERGDLKQAYPHLHTALVNGLTTSKPTYLYLNKREWYEYIVFNGGEGLMLKPLDGTYRHMRGREYTKWKKFITRDVVIVDYQDPSRDYTGKEADNPNAVWHYWYDAEDDSRIVHGDMTMQEAEEQGLLPCTKSYALEWIGTIKYGVLITEEELKAWHKKNPKDKAEVLIVNNREYLVVGKCSGFDDDIAKYVTANKEALLETVIEVGANEIMKTGKLRHPRFIRFRDDKEKEQCTWAVHMGL